MLPKTAIPRARLTNDYEISRILKGCWQLAGGHGPVDTAQAIEDMFQFVESGITTFDFGDIYTGVEELVGNFLRQYGKKYGAQRTRDVQLHTKYVPDLNELSTLTKKSIEEGIDRSLMRLGVESLDLVQFHWWDYDTPGYVEAGLQLTALRDKGKIRNIGVTNFDIQRLSELIEAGVPIVSTQNQYSLLDARPENGLVEFCRTHNIHMLCYGTIAGGFLSEKYIKTPEPQEPFETRSLTKYKLIIDEFGGWGLFQELLEALSKIAKRHNVTITSVANRYIIEKSQVAGLIIGARNTEHLDDHKQIFTFALDNTDISDITDILSRAKGPKGDTYSLERVKGGPHASIMKYNLSKIVT